MPRKKEIKCDSCKKRYATIYWGYRFHEVPLCDKCEKELLSQYTLDIINKKFTPYRDRNQSSNRASWFRMNQMARDINTLGKH